MTWVLILWIMQGSQVVGTGSSGAAITTAHFATKDLCQAAGAAIHDAENHVGYGCFYTGIFKDDDK